MKTFVVAMVLVLVLVACAQKPAYDSMQGAQEPAQAPSAPVEIEQVASEVEGISADLEDFSEIDALDEEFADLENIDLE